MKRANPQKALQALVMRCGSEAAAGVVLGVTQQYVNDLLKNRRPFSDRVLSKLRLRRVVVASR